MTKEYFYSGLCPEHRPIVAHLKDQPNASCMSLLIALQENEQNDAQTHTRYPTNITPTAMGSLNPVRWIGLLTARQEVLPSDLSSWSRKTKVTPCARCSWGLSLKKSTNRKTSSRTPTSTTGWIRVSILTWSKQLIRLMHDLDAASIAWKRATVGESASSCLFCQSCRKYSTGKL